MVVLRSLAELASASDADRHALVGELSAQIAAVHRQTYAEQTKAWRAEINLLCEAAEAIRNDPAFGEAVVVLEYNIPRRQKRPDAVVVTRRALVVVEFKIGAQQADAAARWQVASYALDLRDFHATSAALGVAGLVVATGGRFPTSCTSDTDIPVYVSDGQQLADDVRRALSDAQRASTGEIRPADWIHGSYRPTPTIIEAAELLYQGHGVANINHAYASNLTETTDAIVEYILRAEAERRHIACFVTGVPGAGKTLTGLNAVHDPRLRRGGEAQAVFLSGNGPLVQVVREALARTVVGTSREEARRRVRTFIQNVHVFAREYIDKPHEPPHEHVAIFDEAQRAWSADKMSREGRGGLSEPAQLVHIMERWNNWSVIVALVGGGQEIHDGEAGLAAWGDALALQSRKPWTVVASPEALEGGVAVSGNRLFRGPPPSTLSVLRDPRLHLRISVRAPRARLLAEWVDAVLAGAVDVAAERAKGIRDFPLVGTRDLNTARAWLRARASDGKRAGLVASAGARRLRGYGVQLSTQVGQNSDIDQWFLAEPGDVRSSSMLEVAATEFE
ncbi:MAG TPA: DNA/RNA helicase domain-containing protein, partial [Candidatus Thermoplasmatota archaeon]|nr:DNA/RNA helicase domain-containing protein [Candidatus Thermoplasmatota archaeon]